MAVIASPEFLSLCQVQLRLLVQQMEESSAAIYIADVMTGSADGHRRGHRQMACTLASDLILPL